jgi:ABC-type sugar transport system ATPase subunit
LFSIVRKLRQRGIAILFVSHRLEEIFALCDWISVLRNGEKVSDTSIGQTSIAQVVAEMVGPLKEASKTVRSGRSEGAALTFQDATLGNELNQVSFEVRAGEVVGLAGLEGSGSTAPFDVLFGRSKLQQGEIRLPGGQAAPRSPQDAVKAQIALVPADRRTEGLSVDQDIVANMMAVAAGALGRCGFFLRQRELDRRTNIRADALRLVRSDLRQSALNLSGGNQQKLVLGKWLETQPQILLLDDPTRGVDVGAKAEIHRIISEQAAAGRIILFHSTEFQEYADVCDRVLVFYRGKIVAELNGRDVTEHALLQAANVGQINPGATP